MSPRSLARQQTDVLRVAEGFFDANVIFVLNELGIFEKLANEPCSVDELVSATGADRDALRRLLNAGVSTGFLTLTDQRYRNSTLSESVLVPGRDGYLGNWLKLLSRWMTTWTHLRESVMTGKPAEDSALHLGDDPEYTRDFILAMDDYAQLRGREIMQHLDLGEDALELLDLGGGPGTYAIMFARRWPSIRIKIFDLPEVTKIAAENCVNANVADRVTTLAGNYHEDDIGHGYDVIFLSDTLHQEDPQDSAELLRKSFDALKPGGRLVVQAMFLDESGVSPRWPLMLSLVLLLTYGGGRTYTVSETIEMIEAAGFTDCTHLKMSLLNANALIMAEKPETPTST